MSRSASSSTKTLRLGLDGGVLSKRRGKDALLRFGGQHHGGRALAGESIILEADNVSFHPSRSVSLRLLFMLANYYLAVLVFFPAFLERLYNSSVP